jgi:hypothetical protein
MGSNSKRVIKPKKKYMFYDKYMGQRKTLSEGDVERVNNMYRCSEVVKGPRQNTPPEIPEATTRSTTTRSTTQRPRPTTQRPTADPVIRYQPDSGDNNYQPVVWTSRTPVIPHQIVLPTMTNTKITRTECTNGRCRTVHSNGGAGIPAGFGSTGFESIGGTGFGSTGFESIGGTGFGSTQMSGSRTECTNGVCKTTHFNGGDGMNGFGPMNSEWQSVPMMPSSGGGFGGFSSRSSYSSSSGGGFMSGVGRK